MADSGELARIGLYGLAVMGQNLALNVAMNGFTISVCNRSPAKVDACVERAKKEGLDDKLKGYKDLGEFVQSLSKPRAIILLVKAGKPVDATIEALTPLLEEGDMIIDGGNEWYENTERRAAAAAEKGLNYMGMGVSGGEEGARYGPSMMPGGPEEAYKVVEDILVACSAKHKSGAPCVTWIGPGGAGNYVKMVHNGIEYGDMQLIAEAYDVLKTIGGLNNDELAAVFDEWNSEGNSLQSFLIEISAQIFKKKDDRGDGYLVDKVMDKTGNKGTGKWTCKDACDMGVDSTTMVAALNARYMACMKDERVAASQILPGPEVKQVEDKKAIIEIARQALYASKICSYAQGMSLIQKKGLQNNWNLNLGKIASIWRGGCIIRAEFLDRITEAFEKNPDLPNLLVDEYMGDTVKQCLEGWRKLICLAVTNGVAVPAMAGSLAYFDSYRRARLPANLTQAQRDFFGAHTYQRTDDLANGEFVHSEWSKM